MLPSSFKFACWYINSISQCLFVLQGEQCAHNESIGQGWGIQTVNNVICNGLLSTWLIWWNTLATRCYYNKKNNVTLVWVHPLAPGWHSSPFIEPLFMIWVVDQNSYEWYQFELANRISDQWSHLWSYLLHFLVSSSIDVLVNGIKNPNYVTEYCALHLDQSIN